MSTKILIVDDSTTDRLIISTMLADYQTLTACDGLEAMEFIAKNPDIDLIILDLNMPRMNGFEVLEALQQDPEYRKIHTIILTNYDEIDNEVRGLELGAVDYIRKPLNIQSLLIRILSPDFWKSRIGFMRFPANFFRRPMKRRRCDEAAGTIHHLTYPDSGLAIFLLCPG